MPYQFPNSSPTAQVFLSLLPKISGLLPHRFLCQRNHSKTSQHWRNSLVVFVSGIAMGTTTAPWEWWSLGWVAIMPLWWIVHRLGQVDFPSTHSPDTLTISDVVSLDSPVDVSLDMATSVAVSHPSVDRATYSPRCINQPREQRVLSAWGMGLLWGIGYHGTTLFWITGIHPMTWLGVSWTNSLIIAAVVWLIITLWGAIMSSTWTALMAGLGRNLSVGSRIILGCGLLCSLETLWSWGPLYWSSIAYTQSPHNLLLLQITQLSGQQTMTAALVAVNALLAEGFASGWVYMSSGLHDGLHKQRNQALVNGRRCLWTVIGLLVIMGAYGLWAMQPERMTTANLRPLTVGIIQGNIPNTIKLKPQGWNVAVDNYAHAYETLATQGVDMILTPETALPFLYPERREIRDPFDAAVRRYRVPVWVGGFGKGADYDRTFDYTNSLFLTDGSLTPKTDTGQTDSPKFSPTQPTTQDIHQLTTKVDAQYDKVRLVPVGEYIPLKTLLGGLIKRLSPLQGEVLFGATHQLVDTPWGRLIMGICYESAYPEHFRYQAAAGGQLILTASNNAHYAPAMPAKHHAQDVARAVETNRWAVRATNTGYSGIVDPNGRTVWISGINTYEYHKDLVYLRQTKTPYVQWGDWLTPLLLVTGGSFAGWHHWRRRTNPNT